MKYYQVANYANGFEYVNESSDISDVEKIWTTAIPWNFKPHEDYQPTPPFKFTKRSDAVRIKDAIHSCRKQLFKEDRKYYKMYNDERSPQWKVYTIEETENPK